MNILEKLLAIQVAVDTFVKDGENKSDKYKYVSSDGVLGTIRPKMNELKLLLEPSIAGHILHEGTTRSGTTRYMTEIDIIFTWVDVETGETRKIPFYAQGVDLAGEKGVGKALTYAEKYFLMKYFHVPTSKDDPDNDGRTKVGEQKKRGTQAEKETQEYQKLAITQMLNELCENDQEKVAESCKIFSKNPENDTIEKIPLTVLPIVYAKAKKTYEDRTNRTFSLRSNTSAV